LTSLSVSIIFLRDVTCDIQLGVSLVCLGCSSMSAFQDVNQPPVTASAADDLTENSTANIEPSTSQDVTSPPVLMSVPAANDVTDNSTANIEPSTSRDVTSPPVSVSVPAANDIMQNSTANTVPSRACDVSLPASRIPHPGLEQAMAILAELSPPPKLKSARPRTRKAESASIITSSPYKASVIAKMVGRKTGSKRQSANNTEEVKPKRTKKNTAKVSKTAHQETDETPCIICCRKYNEPPFEDWIACSVCGKWYHESCGPDDEAICYNCVA